MAARSKGDRRRNLATGWERRIFRTVPEFILEDAPKQENLARGRVLDSIPLGNMWKQHVDVLDPVPAEAQAALAFASGLREWRDARRRRREQGIDRIQL